MILGLTVFRCFASVPECAAAHDEIPVFAAPVLADGGAVRLPARQLAGRGQRRRHSRISAALSPRGVERAVARRHRLDAASLGHDAGDRRRVLPGGRRRRGAGRGDRLVAADRQCAGALPGLRQHPAQGGDRAAVPDLDGLRHLAQHADGRADRLLPGGDQHRRGPEPDRGRHARPRPRVQRAEMEDLRQDPHPQRPALHPERAQDHGDGRRGRRHRRRVRRLAEGPGLRHHHHPEQHEHLGGVRRADLDFHPRAAALRRRRACRRACGRRGPKA